MPIARSRLVSIALGFALATGSGAAHAQATGFQVNRFEPAERGSMWFVLESLDLRGRGRPALGVTGDWQYRPLAVYAPDGSVRASVIQHMVTAHLGASIVLVDRLRLGVNVPLIAYTTGEPARLAGVGYLPPAHEQAIGDVRLGADVRLFGEYDSPITMAFGAQLWLPTGDTASYTGDGRARVEPRLLAAGVLGSFTYAAKLGVMFRDPEAGNFANSPTGHELVYAAAAGVRAADGRLVIGPELFGSTVLTDASFKTRTTPFEALLGFHYAFVGGVRAGAGIGTGVTRGYGAPQVRGVLSLEWSPDVIEDRDGDGVPDKEDACPTTPGVRSADPEKNGCPVETPRDRDGDGILDANDACPDVPGVASDDPKKNGCPPDADRDNDGVFDAKDACPDVPGIKSEDPKKNGCPPDTDGDGVLDSDDACPDVPGLRTDDPKTNGCPDPDRDKDGIPNDQDACPDEPGKPSPDPKRNGCPKAFVQAGQIKILDQVKFKTGSAEILPGKDSEEVLQAVSKVLADHPEIKGLRIEGHTDNRGGAELNRKLSAGRAASVVKWLVKHGIDPSRLKSAGFGPDRAADTNDTEAGRQNNRRVEFHIEGGSGSDGGKPDSP